MGLEKLVESVKHHACPDSHFAFLEVKVTDLPVVP
jgi:hypothetical protein